MKKKNFKTKIVKIGMVLFCFLCIFSITACKKQKTYQIVYEVDENNPSSNYTIQFKENETVKLDIPQKEGYRFIGWYQDETLITSITNQNYHLSAKWEKIYTIEYMLNGGTLEGNYPTIFSEDEKVDLPMPVRSGYEFIGWYQENNLVTNITNQNYRLSAKWEKVYQITYVIDVGVMPEEYIEYYHVEQEEKLPTPQRTGYQFIGWKESPTSTRTMLTIPISYEEDLTLYPSWEKVTYRINYQFPNQIYINKEALFMDFFSDFYNYIVNYLGEEDTLKQKGVNNLTDFLSIAGAWSGGAAGMGQIGNLAGSYYLRIDAGGDIKNQTAEDGFIGYCLENNQYVEFIYFLQEFFYWWRLDEGYTGGSSDPENTGSDFLASAWASLVDTAKFFYYEKDTLPSYFILKGHIPEMYDRIPYIVKTQNMQLVYAYDWEVGLTLPNDLIIEGYTFLGWYDNPEYTGSALTVLETNIYQDIILYAKLEKKQK